MPPPEERIDDLGEPAGVPEQPVPGGRRGQRHQQGAGHRQAGTYDGAYLLLQGRPVGRDDQRSGAAREGGQRRAAPPCLVAAPCRPRPGTGAEAEALTEPGTLGQQRLPPLVDLVFTGHHSALSPRARRAAVTEC
ncbi:MAG: hypothetical protein ACRDNF_15770 [Streptosporangiaceae bacterium]